MAAEQRQIEWGSADVEDGVLTVQLAGLSPKGWKARFAAEDRDCYLQAPAFDSFERLGAVGVKIDALVRLNLCLAKHRARLVPNRSRQSPTSTAPISAAPTLQRPPDTTAVVFRTANSHTGLRSGPRASARLLLVAARTQRDQSTTVTSSERPERRWSRRGPPTGQAQNGVFLTSADCPIISSKPNGELNQGRVNCGRAFPPSS